jgi:glycosyltransferase involved in cell wall biosynthesis
VSVKEGRRKGSYLEVRHDLEGLLEISNQYLTAFTDQGFHTIVVCLKSDRDPRIIERIPADRVIVLEQPRWDPFNLSAVVAIGRLCRRCRVTHIVTHRYRPAFIVGLATLFYRPSLVLAVIHGQRQFARVGRRVAARILFRKPWFKLIGVSESARQDILDSLPEKDRRDVIAVPNCIDVDKTESQLLSVEAARARLGIGSEPFVFGNIGRLAAAKDQLTLIRAFHAAQEQMDNAILVIIGWGGLEPVLKAEIERLGLGDKIILTGRIDQAWCLMRAFDCFVATSVSEGFGLVLIEAMVARRPIIATRIGSFSEILGNRARLFECGDYEAIGRAMASCYRLSDQQRMELASKGYERVQQRFSTTAFRVRIVSLIDAR